MHVNSSTHAPPVQQDSPRFLIGTLDAKATLDGVCPYAKALLGFSKTYGATLLCSLPCKRWGCRTCGPRKARKMAYRVEHAAPNKFITLTCNANHMESPRQVYDRTRRNLSELAKVLRKRLGEFEYLRILEVTKKGMPHYHLVARCPYIQQSDLSQAWNSLTNAPIVDIRKIQKSDNVFRYMIKYLCKQTHIPWTDRRASWTRKFFKPEPDFQTPDLGIIGTTRHKLTPSQLAAKYFPGKEVYKLTPTAFLIIDESRNLSMRMVDLLGEERTHDDDPPSDDF